MTNKQLQVYGARISLAWFRAAEELGSVSAACKHYGIARSEYYYWHSRWFREGKALTSLYNKPTTPKSHAKDVSDETVSLVIQLHLSLGYGEEKLAVVLARDYGVKVSHHGVGNILRRAALTMPKPRKHRAQRRLSDYPYIPVELGQMDVKHWKRAAYQYDIIDTATRIKYKRLYPGVNLAYTVDSLEHAVRFFGPASTIQTIQTDNGLESLSTTKSPKQNRPWNIYKVPQATRMLHWIQVSYMFRSATLLLTAPISYLHGRSK